jgi:hypothetical protein
MKLFQILIGCRPKGRHTEQHDVYFGIAENLKDILPQLKIFWPEAYSNMHLDGVVEITHIDGYDIIIEKKNEEEKNKCNAKLFFINLGGYKPNELEEYHYKMVIAGISKTEAIKAAKASAFYKHTGFKGAESHIDDKYGIDVDDVYAIEDILLPSIKEKYCIVLKQNVVNNISNKMQLGYMPLKKIIEGKERL